MRNTLTPDSVSEYETMVITAEGHMEEVRAQPKPNLSQVTVQENLVKVTEQPL